MYIKIDQLLSAPASCRVTFGPSPALLDTCASGCSYLVSSTHPHTPFSHLNLWVR